MQLQFEIRIKTPWLSMIKRQNRQRVLAALMLVGESLRSRLARYPGPVKRPIAWLNLRQRRAYFARMAAAGDRPPYRRTTSRLSERLGKSYVIIPRSERRVVVESKASYSAFVQSKEFQQPFHRYTGWITDAQVVDQVRRSSGLKHALEKLFL